VRVVPGPTHTLVYFSGGSPLLVRESPEEVRGVFVEKESTAAVLTHMGGGKGDLEVTIFRHNITHILPADSSGQLAWQPDIA
jgi:hypothetical protein